MGSAAHSTAFDVRMWQAELDELRKMMGGGGGDSGFAQNAYRELKVRARRTLRRAGNGIEENGDVWSGGEGGESYPERCCRAWPQALKKRRVGADEGEAQTQRGQRQCNVRDRGG